VDNEYAVAVVLGPTGSGKSDLALRIAEEFGGEIVNCDSVQVFKGFDIGTAKTPPGERRGIPHHLIDVIDPTGLFTAGDYASAARAVLSDVAKRGRLPVVVGGTGFYLRALIEGLSAGPRRDEELRARLLGREQKRAGSLHKILSRLDPEAAARIHPNDRNKTLRALEIRILEDQPAAKLFLAGREPLAGFKPLRIGLNPDRELLYRKLDARAAAMFDGGLLEEVSDLLASGVPPDAKPFESLGYAQALQVLNGRLTKEQAIEATQQETRRYAKRQLTWFRREQDVHWLRGFGDEPEVQAQALALVAIATKAKSNRAPHV